MSMKTTVAAGMLGISLTLTAVPMAHSETLKIVNGAASSALTVPMNRAVIVESDQPFAELSIANPGIADISTLSDRSIYVLGKAPGRTTVVECEDLLMIRADGTLTKMQGVLSTRDAALTAEISRSMLDDLAHKELWDVAEALSGYPVTAVLADQSIDPDVAIICFVLDKPDDD